MYKSQLITSRTKTHPKRKGKTKALMRISVIHFTKPLKLFKLKDHCTILITLIENMIKQDNSNTQELKCEPRK